MGWSQCILQLFRSLGVQTRDQSKHCSSYFSKFHELILSTSRQAQGWLPRHLCRALREVCSIANALKALGVVLRRAIPSLYICSQIESAAPSLNQTHTVRLLADRPEAPAYSAPTVILSFAFLADLALGTWRTVISAVCVPLTLLVNLSTLNSELVQRACWQEAVRYRQYVLVSEFTMYVRVCVIKLDNENHKSIQKLPR
jgi:hypothetical protein